MNSNLQERNTSMRTLVVGALAACLLTACPSAAPAVCQTQGSVGTVQLGGYAVRLTRTGALPAGCDETAAPAVFGDYWVFDALSDHRVQFHAGTSMAFGTDDAGNALPAPPGSVGVGQFATVDPVGDTCTMPSITPVSVGAGADLLRYEITNLTFLSGALYLGTEFKGEIAVTRGSCTAAYTVLGINPPVPCASNADCDPAGKPFSSGINGAYDQACNTEAWTGDVFASDPGICFFRSEYPSLGGFPR